jgi:hypothetical protein
VHSSLVISSSSRQRPAHLDAGESRRPVVVYLLLVVALRAFGNASWSQLNPFDLVVLLTLSNTVQKRHHTATTTTSLTGGIVGAAALLAVNALLVRFFYRGPGMEQRMMQEHDVYLIPRLPRAGRYAAQAHINLGELNRDGSRTGVRRSPRTWKPPVLISERDDLYEGHVARMPPALREVRLRAIIRRAARDIAAMRHQR